MKNLFTFLLLVLTLACQLAAHGQTLDQIIEHNNGQLKFRSIPAPTRKQALPKPTTQNSRPTTDKPATGQARAKTSGSARLTAVNSETLTYSGQIVTYTVPTGVFSLSIETRGAEGGDVFDGTPYRAGKGAIISGTVSVTPGQQLKVLVGQQGNGNGGGGGTFVTKIDNTPLVVAGGGGGSGSTADDANQKQGQAGNSGGFGAGAGAGLGGSNGNGGQDNPQGAFASTSGGGLLTDGISYFGASGQAFVNGGAGGDGGNGSAGGFGGGGTGSGRSAGGGGGGYSGGGQGGRSGGGVGGGGGSYNADPNGSNTAGANSGDGVVIITILCTSFTATLTPSGQLSCANKTVSLIPGGGLDGATYQYSAGAINKGAMATVSNDGPYSVTVTNPGGCSSVAITNVSSNTTAPNATLNNNGPITTNQPTVTLTAGGGNTYQFSLGAAQQGAGNTATVTTPGQYQVTVTNSSNGCTATASTVVTGAISGSSCRNGTGVIKVVANGTPVKYEWYRNSINSARLTENPAQVRGTSTASLTLVNQQVTADYYVRVTDANGSAVVYGPFRFTVNLGCNVYARQGAEVVELRISVLGNPVQGDQLRATISGAEGKALNVQLLDLSGKPLHSQQWGQAEAQHDVEWNLGDQSSGIYLLQATTPDQRHSQKVIKQ
jgi:hypothetical protein